jgi:ZIP family zinc transporter
MLIYISTKELVPTARKYDHVDTIVTASIIIGMLIMAVALVLFGFESGTGILV